MGKEAESSGVMVGSAGDQREILSMGVRSVPVQLLPAPFALADDWQHVAALECFSECESHADLVNQLDVRAGQRDEYDGMLVGLVTPGALTSHAASAGVSMDVALDSYLDHVAPLASYRVGAVEPLTVQLRAVLALPGAFATREEDVVDAADRAAQDLVEELLTFALRRSCDIELTAGPRGAPLVMCRSRLDFARSGAVRLGLAWLDALREVLFLAEVVGGVLRVSSGPRSWHSRLGPRSAASAAL